VTSLGGASTISRTSLESEWATATTLRRAAVWCVARVMFAGGAVTARLLYLHVSSWRNLIKTSKNVGQHESIGIGIRLNCCCDQKTTTCRKSGLNKYSLHYEYDR
jgi:hypothetical protein